MDVRLNFVCIVVIAASSVTIGAADAQRRPAGATAAKQGIRVALTVAGQPYQSNEPGKCTYAPTASIYQLMSELWSVEQNQDGRSLALSLWRPKDGSGDMVTLSVRNAGTSHNVNTVRGGGPVSGAGKATFAKAGAGGTFTIDVKTQNGVAITGTITCDTIAPHVAEGGDENVNW